MEVVANITRLDLLWLNLYIIPRIKLNYIVLGIGSVFTFIVELITTRPTQIEQIVALFLVILIIFTFAVLITSLIIILIYIFAVPSKKDGILGRHYFVIQNDGFREITVVNDMLHKWQGIRLITKFNSYIFIKINLYQYHIIPKRAFNTEEDFNAFWQELNAKLKII